MTHNEDAVPMLTMRISFAWMAAVLSLAAMSLLLLLGQPLAVKTQEPKRFQYRIIEVRPDTQNMQTRLNEFGAAGWELVVVWMGDMMEPRLIFKK